MSSESKKGNRDFLMQGAVLAAAGMLTRLIGLAYRIPMNNILGDEGQGFYGVAFEIYSIALLLTSYSLPLAMSKLVSSRKAQGKMGDVAKVLKTGLMFALVVGGAVALIVGLLCRRRRNRVGRHRFARLLPGTWHHVSDSCFTDS